MKRLALACLALTLSALSFGCGTMRPDTEALSAETYAKAFAIIQTQSRSPDPIVRANCIEAMQVSRDPRAILIIEQGLRDNEWVVRFAAAMAAGKRKITEVRPVLNSLVTRDTNGSVRAGCIYALRRLDDTTHMNDLPALLVARDNSTRANTAYVIGILGDESAIPMLQLRREESDIRVKFELTAALARLGDEPSQQVIAGWAVNRFAEDQWSAMVVCADLPQDIGLSPLLLGLEPVPPKLPDQIDGKSVDKPMVQFLTTCRQLVAARSLAKLQNSAGVKVAIDTVDDKMPHIRALSCMALGEMLTLSQSPGLYPSLEDPNETVQRAAAAAILNVYSRSGGKQNP